MNQGSDRDERWEVPYRIVQSDKLYYVQMQFNTGVWYTLSEMQNNGNTYHFMQYRNWTDMKYILKWWKKAPRTNILNTNVWMPSEALNNIVVASDYKQILKDYPELLI